MNKVGNLLAKPFRFLAMSVAVVSFLQGNDSLQAAQPRFLSIRPLGGQIGTEVDVTISGRNLEDAQEIMAYESGIKVLKFEVNPKQKGRSIKVRLKIDPKCSAGNHRLRVRTKTGLSEIQNFSVGFLPTVEEKEPNSDFQKPQSVKFGTTIHGRIDREDVDYFVFEAKKGQRIAAEVEGVRLGTPYMGRSFFDPYIAIMSMERFELAASDDETLANQDGFTSIIAPKSGKYILAIRDSSYNGGGSFLYRLHLGDFPRPVGVLPAGAKPGEKVKFKFQGDIRGDIVQEITIPKDASLGQTFSLYASDKSGTSPTSNMIRISNLKNVMEVEPNDTRAQATPFSGQVALNGCLEKINDDDYYKVHLKKGQQVELEVFGRRLRSKIDSAIYIYDGKGKYLTYDDDRRRPDSWIRFKAPKDDDYYVMIRDHLHNGGPEYTYRLEITESRPSLKVTTMEKVLYYQPTMQIPKGTRLAFLVSAQRTNFGGELQISAKGLPKGVRLEVPKGVGSENVIPVMLHADKKATVGGVVSQFQVTPKDKKYALASTNLVQNHLRIRGRNQNSYVRMEKTETIPVVITEESPFDIRVVQPKVPIIQGSSMRIKVIATRKKGFDEEIKLFTLRNPSGVSSSQTVKIPKGKNEVVIPFTASGRAAIKESPITIRGTARVGNGNVEVYSPFVMLSVEKPYLKLEFQAAAAEKGKESVIVAKVKHQIPFSGKAKVILKGLPAKTSVEPMEVTKDTQEIAFKLKVEPNAAVGKTKSLFANVTVIDKGEPVLHKLGYGRLRIDRPFVPKKPKPKVKKPKPTVKKTPVKIVKKPKPLSRLEQLRLRQKEQNAAAQ